MNITVVTSFDKEGLELYGQRFLDSFSRKVDPKVKLLAYANECSPQVDNSSIRILDSNKSIPELQKFKDKWKDTPKATGVCPRPELNPDIEHETFRWDAIKYANKAYALADASKKSFDWIVWMDADVYIHSQWAFDDFVSLLPEKAWVAYTGNSSNNKLSDCGFYGLNLNKQPAWEFIEELHRMYEDAERGIFTLNEWHDLFVFSAILERMKRGHKNFMDYSEDLRSSGQDSSHPIINTCLGKWIDHLKGDRKTKRHSSRTDLIVPRTESYWKKV